MRLIGPKLHGHPQQPPPAAASTPRFAPGHGRPWAASAFMSQSGALGPGGDRPCPARRVGPVVLRLGRQTRRDISGNDLPGALGVRPADRPDAALPGVLRQPPAASRAWRGAVGRTKPILAVKSGRSGGRAPGATSSHTGAMLAASDAHRRRIVRAVGASSGRTPLGELFDVASLLASPGGRPPGGRVGIVTNGGRTGHHVRGRLRGRWAGGARAVGRNEGRPGRLPARRGRRRPNPIDMIASAAPDDYERTLRTVAQKRRGGRAGRHLHPAAGHLSRRGSRPRSARAAGGRSATACPLLGVFMGGDASPAGPDGTRVPVYAFPRGRGEGAGARLCAGPSGRAQPEEPAWTAPDARSGRGPRRGRGGAGTRRVPGWGRTPSRTARLLRHPAGRVSAGHDRRRGGRRRRRPGRPPWR